MNLCFERAVKGCLALQAVMPRVTPAQNVASFFTMQGVIYYAQGILLCEGEIHYAMDLFHYERGKLCMDDGVHLCFERAAKGCLAFQAAMPRVTPAQNVATTRHDSAALFDGCPLKYKST